jgi:osmoprotectant transport system permease protein
VKALRDPLLWLVALFVALLFLMPHSAALFNALFPGLPRPVYQQESFINLALAHLWLVALSSAIAVVLGVGAGIAVTRPAGRSFARWWRRLRPSDRRFPGGGAGDSGAGDGLWSAACHYCADLYGVLPVLQGTLAGLAAVPASVLSVAEGMGMSRGSGCARLNCR